MGAIFAPVQRFAFANSTRSFCAEEILQFFRASLDRAPASAIFRAADDTQGILCNDRSHFRDRRARISACKVIVSLPDFRSSKLSVFYMPQLKKTSSGIKGLDELTGGGLPAGRPTLVCGGPGCGKTLLATTFLVKGALDHNEPGVFISFDERIADLRANVASLGFDLPGLEKRGLIALDHVFLDRQAIEEAGDYDLEGLFVRIAHAVKKVDARRVVLDSIDTLFAGIPSIAIVRSELSRLFAWFKERGLTVVITAERGDTGITRNGVEEYVSDCVIVVDHRVNEQSSTRRLRVVKYRGSTHGSNEYPFLIDHDGITVLPVTSLGLAQIASNERVSSGVASLDAMLEGKGYFKGSSILLGGGAGTGKTSIAAHFAEAACHRGERCVFFSFEESPSQLARNMGSIGIDLQSWADKSAALPLDASEPAGTRAASGLDTEGSPGLSPGCRGDRSAFGPDVPWLLATDPGHVAAADRLSENRWRDGAVHLAAKSRHR
jgi:KaiC/GvpD/RAD55 family RecA-like ATPase